MWNWVACVRQGPVDLHVNTQDIVEDHYGRTAAGACRRRPNPDEATASPNELTDQLLELRIIPGLSPREGCVARACIYKNIHVVKNFALGLSYLIKRNESDFKGQPCEGASKFPWCPVPHC